MLSNEYGQIAQSSLGECVDLLLEALTLYAYGPHERPPEESVPAVDGVIMSPKSQHNPQHQISTSGIGVVNPSFAAEKKAFEKSMWKQLRRAYDRLRALDEGLCLKCRNENDQRHHRYCSQCEAKIQERLDIP